MNKNGLVIRLAIVIVFAASIVGFIAGQVFFRITYLNEMELGNKEIYQLTKTVSSTASIATYLEDKDIATEVVNGLITNDIIRGAAIVTDSINIGSTGFISNQNTLHFDLHSPFEQEKKMGTLSISPNLDYIETRADKIGYDNAIALTAEAAAITVITLVIAYVVITNPIIATARSLHKIIPGTSERVVIPEYHNESELGTLVKDINKLLDKTEQQLARERNLRNEVELLEKRFRMLFENSTAPIVLTEPQGNILLYNKAFSSLVKEMAIPLKQSYGPYLIQLFADPKRLENTVQQAFVNDETATGEFKLCSKDKSKTLWVQAVITSTLTTDYKEYYQVTLHDISKRKKQLELLNYKANYDTLTQLLNRQAVETAIQSFIDNDTHFALILMDLNDFKPINDIYGHQCGDEILVHVAGQLKTGLRKCDLLSRWGGDEFVIILPNVSKKDIELVAQKLIQKIRKPFYLNEHDKSVSVTACMGVSFYPKGHKSLHDLVKSADQAMYSVKKEKDPELYLRFFDYLNNPDRS